ncbi:MAG: FAD-binding protein [Candidatus Hodarchaeota archaeon]
MSLNYDKEKCTGCGFCEKVCPFESITIVKDEVSGKKKASIDMDTCRLCGACVNACKFDALEIEQKPLSPEALSKFKDVFVWVECEIHDGSTRAKKVAYELIGEARNLASALDEKVVAVLAGHGVETLALSLIQHGADKVYVLEHELLEVYSTDGYTNAIVDLLIKQQPSIMLFGATPNGRDLAPRIAARLNLGLTADCTGLSIDENKQLVQTRPAFGGNIMASILSPYTRPQLATVRPNVFPKPEVDRARTGQVEKFDVKLEKISIRVKVLEEEKQQEDKDDIREANVVVSGGRGLCAKENVGMLKELADQLDGTWACSRAIVDLGWTPSTRQVGQSGKTIAPTIYLALGISGAVQHLVGMSGSDTIIAINSDPDAPIFKVADFGVIGDIFEIVPKLIEKIKKYRQG